MKSVHRRYATSEVLLYYLFDHVRYACAIFQPFFAASSKTASEIHEGRGFFVFKNDLSLIFFWYRSQKIISAAFHHLVIPTMLFIYFLQFTLNGLIHNTLNTLALGIAE